MEITGKDRVIIKKVDWTKTLSLIKTGNEIIIPYTEMRVDKVRIMCSVQGKKRGGHLSVSDIPSQSLCIVKREKKEDA